MSSEGLSHSVRQMALSLDAIKVYNLTVDEVIQFERGTTDESLPRLILYEKVTSAVHGHSHLEQLVQSLFHIYTDMTNPFNPDLAITEGFSEFLQNNDDTGTEGGEVTLSLLVKQINSVIEHFSEQRLRDLLVSLGQRTAEKLSSAIQALMAASYRPCARGHELLTTEMLYPYIKPFLQKPRRKHSLADLLPLLELLHSGCGVRNGAHGREWAQFEDAVLSPFLAQNPAIDAWLA